MRFVVTLLVAAVGSYAASAPRTELLWPNGAPGALGDEDKDKPSITIYLPDAEKATGTGVIVAPGGGYGNLAIDHEGKQVAEWFISHGVAAFILKYRLGPKNHHPIELGDAQKAIRTVRARAKEFRIAPDKVGIMGFSAGGHLASTASTHFGLEDGVSSRPDFAILCYPVISFKDPFAHTGSRRNLLGETPDPALVESLSNETQVTRETPPTFLFHTNADTGVPPENSVQFYLALRRAGIPAEMHIFEKGRHGVGLAPTDPILSYWPPLLANWLRTRGLIPAK